jgi:cytosine/adenosine deaminase-related metal-dependent hydrolase
VSGGSYYDYTAAELAALGDALARGPGQILFRGAAVVTADEAATVLPAGDVLVAGRSVAAVGADLRAQASPDAVVVNCRGTIIAPGFVDAHRHCWQGQLRRLIPDASIAGYWATIVGQGLAVAYRPDDMYAGVLIALAGALDAGITTVVDFSHNSATSEHADAVFAAYREAGARVVHVSCPPETDRWEPRWPGELVRLRDTYTDASAMVTLRLGINKRRRAPVTELMAMARDEGLAITFDAISGDRATAELTGLAALGLLAPDVNLTHCNALSPRAWDAIVASGATVTVAPLSDEHFGIADGLPPIRECMEYGVRPGIGIDVETGLPSDMFSQMRCLLATQRQHATRAHYGSDAPAPRLLTVAEVLEFATRQGARTAGLDSVTGSIVAGEDADLIIIGAEDINNLPLNSPVGTVVLGADPRNIAAVFVAGRLQKWDRQLVNHDAARIRALARSSLAHLAGGQPHGI